MFKLVSLQLIDSPAVSEHILPPTAVLWKSTLPPPEHHVKVPPPLPSVDDPKLNDWCMHLYIPFGGHDGSRLSTLSSIVALLDGVCGFYALKFIYREDEVVYGLTAALRDLGVKDTCVEQVCLIDGPGGERITELAYSSKRCPQLGYRCISAIEVSEKAMYG